MCWFSETCGAKNEASGNQRGGKIQLGFPEIRGRLNPVLHLACKSIQYLPEEWINAIWKSIKGRDLGFQAKNGARCLDGNLRRGAKGYITTQ